jgi:hypothetical protein
MALFWMGKGPESRKVSQNELLFIYYFQFGNGLGGKLESTMIVGVRVICNQRLTGLLLVKVMISIRLKFGAVTGTRRRQKRFDLGRPTLEEEWR